MILFFFSFVCVCVCVCVCEFVHVHCLKGKFRWLHCCFVCFMVTVQLYSNPNNIFDPRSNIEQGTS